MDRKSLAWLVFLVLLAGVASLSLLSCGGGGGGSSPKPRDEVMITPPGQNRAPVIERTVDGITLTLVAGTTVQWESADIDTYFSDPDNDALEYEATSSNTGVVDTVFSQTDSTLIVRAAGAGTATVTVTATDPEGLSATQSFTVTVFPADHSDTDAGASEIIAGKTVEGYINSPDDVDYFLFRVSEPGVYEIVLESNLPGLEISLQDENGHTLAVDQTESPAVIVVALKVAALQIVIRCSANPICVAAVVEAFTAALAPEQSNALTVLKFVVAVAKLFAEETEEPELRPDAPLVGVCRCLLAIVEPEGEIEEIDLNDYFEGQTGDALNFSVRGQIPKSLTVNLDGATGLLEISAPRGAELGIHELRLEVEEEDNPETSAVFTVNVNVSALPRQLPGRSLTVRAEPGERKSIDLTEIIGPPENVGGHRPIRFQLDVNDPGTQPSLLDLSARISSKTYLVVEPPSDLLGEFSLKVSAWFPDAERSKDFTFRVLVGSVPRRIDGSPPLSVELRQGGEATIKLTDYIEDPLGGTLAFAYGTLPRGFGVTRDGPDWTIAVDSDTLAARYSIVVTATNGSGLSADFAFQVVVEEGLGEGWRRAQNVDCHIYVGSGHSSGHSNFPMVLAGHKVGTYSGECSASEAHGEGTWTFNTLNLDDNGYLLRYDGQWQNGRRHGLGTWTHYQIYTGGSHYEGYEGQWQDELPHGRGISWKNRVDYQTFMRYEGQFQYGYTVGQGTLVSGVATGRGHDQEVDTSRSYCRLEGEFRLWGLSPLRLGSEAPGVEGLWNGTVTAYPPDGPRRTFQVRNGDWVHHAVSCR